MNEVARNFDDRNCSGQGCHDETCSDGRFNYVMEIENDKRFDNGGTEQWEEFDGGSCNGRSCIDRNCNDGRFNYMEIGNDTRFDNGWEEFNDGKFNYGNCNDRNCNDGRFSCVEIGNDRIFDNGGFERTVEVATMENSITEVATILLYPVLTLRKIIIAYETRLLNKRSKRRKEK